ncbi:MAG: PAS domain S-box protein [Caldilineaceae bacterium]
MLTILLFVIGVAASGAHFWARFLLPLVVVFLWGRRRDIYAVTAFTSMLIAATFWLSESATFGDFLASHLLPIAVLWSAAWLLVRQRRLQEQLLQQQQDLEQQVAARTAELRAGEQRYRMLTEHSRDLVYSVDMDGKLTYVSPAVVHLRGVTPEEEMAASWAERMTPPSAASVERTMDADLAALRAGVPVDDTPRMRQVVRKDGTLIWTETIMSPLFDDDGKPLGLCGFTRDVTARQAAEEALRRSEEQLVTIFRSSPAGITITRLSDGCFVEANETFLQVVGYTRAELIGRTSLELRILTPNGRAAMLAALSADGRASGLDLQIRCANGAAAYILAAIEQIDYDGEPCLLFHTVDITERKRLERELQQSQALLQTMLDASPAIITLRDLAGGRYREVNRAFLEVTGFTRAELMGRTSTEVGILSPEDNEAIRTAVRAYGRTGGTDLRLYRRYGTHIDLHFAAQRVTVDGEEHILSVGIDISERKRLEQALRESEERFRLIVDNSPDVVALYDQQGCMSYISPAVETAHGFSAEHALALDPLLVEAIVTPPGTGPRAAELDRLRSHPYYAERIRIHDVLMYCLAHPGVQRRLEIRSAGPTGEAQYVDVAYRAHQRVEGTSQVVTVTRDITERKRLEQALQALNAELEDRVAQRTASLETALAELQAASRLKDEFMAMISHELRTPLTGVLSLAELLEERFAGPLSARQATYVRGVIENGERLLNVVNGILGYTRLLGSRVQLQSELYELAYVLGTCAASQQYKIAAKNQGIIVQIEPQDLTITGDATALAEVIKRLIDNAVKFTPEGGQIGLEAHPGAAAGTVDLVVWDTGSGIAADQLEHVLKPFTQADSRLARSHEGIGLGLAYVAQMVRMMGGTVVVKSIVGEGSRFVVTLPV